MLKDTYLEFSYSIAYNRNTNERITNIKSINGKYESLVDTLSNAFEFSRLVNTPGLNFRLNKKKHNFSFGSSFGFSHFIQNNITEDRKDDYNYINYFPRLSYTYKIKPNQSVRFNYNGSTSAPTLEQLQPTRVNTDPLNVYIGNPNLKQSFRHSFNTGYNLFNVLKERNLFSNLSLAVTENAFVQSSIVDSVGRRTYQTVNTDGVYYMNFYSDYGFKITKAKLRFSLGPTASISRNIDFINGVRNLNSMRNIGMRVSLSKHVENKFNFYISPNFTRVHSKASVNPAADAKYWQMDGWASANVPLPHKFELGTDMNFQLREKDPRFTQNNSYTTWNASIIKRFMKGNDLEVKLNVYDVLNQNKGYNRNFNSYSFTETHYTTLRRFWLVSLIWNISKNGKPVTTF